MEIESLSEQIEIVRKHIERACAAVAEDAGASPVLAAVLRELQRKGVKAAGLVAEATKAREAVVELEEAADCARVAAEADGGAAEGTREAVDRAHTATCLLKAAQGS